MLGLMAGQYIETTDLLQSVSQLDCVFDLLFWGPDFGATTTARVDLT